MLREYPLFPQLLAMSRVWQSPDGQEYIIAAKGAPEEIADLCHFDAAQCQVMHTQIDGMANCGLRVVAVARGAPGKPARLPLRVPGSYHRSKGLGPLCLGPFRLPGVAPGR